MNHEPRTTNHEALKRWSRTAALLALAASLTMCNKEAQETPSQEIETADDVLKIQAFVAQAKEPGGAKDLGYYTQEEALFILEGALNYGQIDPEAKGDELEFDEFNAEVSFAEFKVTEQELVDAFNYLNAEFLAQPMHAGYKMLATDVVARASDGNLIFTATRVSGKEPLGLAGPPVQTSFSQNYRNRSNSALPPCNPQDVAADRVIQYRINSAIGVQTNDYILTNVETWRVRGCTPYINDAVPEVAFDELNHIIPATYFPNPNDPDGVDLYLLDSYNDYLTYLNPLTVAPVFPTDAEPSCLSPTALSYLTQSAWTLMTTVKNTYASNGLVPIACRVQGYRVNAGQELPGQFRVGYAHNVEFIYGRWQYIGSH